MGTIVREWLQEGRQEGLQETIIETLSLRFGELTDELEEGIQKAKDLTRLRALHRQAVLVDRLENFTLA